MNLEIEDDNKRRLDWCPRSHKEFCSQARTGRVNLNPLDHQYAWLYRSVLPFRFALWSLFSEPGYYERRVLGMMIDDQELFNKVHVDKGIDLILLPRKADSNH